MHKPRLALLPAFSTVSSVLASMVPIFSLPKHQSRPGRKSSTKRSNGERYPHSNRRQRERYARQFLGQRFDFGMFTPHVPANSGPGMDMTIQSRQVRRRAEINSAKEYLKGLRDTIRNDRLPRSSRNWRHVVAFRNSAE